MALISTKDGEIDESELQVLRVEQRHEEGEYKAMIITSEWCRIGCTGQAHRTGTPDHPGHFCSQHVKRDLNVNVIQLPAGLSEIFRQIADADATEASTPQQQL